jgi:hypothetical protein
MTVRAPRYHFGDRTRSLNRITHSTPLLTIYFTETAAERLLLLNALNMRLQEVSPLETSPARPSFMVSHERESTFAG